MDMDREFVVVVEKNNQCLIQIFTKISLQKIVISS